jgi:hypothetical protein
MLRRQYQEALFFVARHTFTPMDRLLMDLPEEVET